MPPGLEKNMHVSRIYTPDLALQLGQICALNEASSHHLSVVLRRKLNSPVILFNGTESMDYGGHIHAISKKQVLVRLDAVIQKPELKKMPVNLYPSLIKNEAFDWIIQKSTELGVTAICPLFTEYTDVKINQDFSKKRLHWEKIIIHATEQSDRNFLPQIGDPLLIKDLSFRSDLNRLNLLLHPDSGILFKDYLRNRDTSHFEFQEINLFVGPEGGFSDRDFKNFEANAVCCEIIKLEPGILRSETAAIAFLAMVYNLFL